MRLSVLAPLPGDVAAQFPDDPSGRRGAPHITVLHVDSDESADQSVVRDVVARVAAAGAPLDVELAGPPRLFGGDDGLRAVALDVRDEWPLRLLRLALRAALREAGVATPQTYAAYEPHATLLYQPEGAAYDGPVPTGPVNLATLLVTIDGDQAAVVLGNRLESAPPLAENPNGRPGERLTSDLEQVRRAIREKKKLAFRYTRSTGEQTVRTVRPFELQREEGGWVLAAFCELRQAFRTFRVQRITQLELLDEPFDRLHSLRPDADDTGRGLAALMALRFGRDLEAEAQRRMPDVDLPDGWVVGSAFRTLVTGDIYCRWTGKRRGKPITEADLRDAVAIFETGEQVGIDVNHNTDEPDGTVLAMWVVDDGDRHSLAVLPAYGPRIAAFVAKSSGSLWSSPEVIWGPVHDPRTGQLAGQMRVHSLAVTPDPAQATRVLDRVRLSARGGTDPLPPSEGEDSSPGPEERMEEFKEAMAAMAAQLAAFGERIGKIEERMAADPEAEPPAEGQGEGAEEAAGEERYAALKALKAQVAQLTARAAVAERDAIVGELLASARISPAEKAAAEKVFERGGADLVREVYGNRKPNSAVPSTKGHGHPTEANPGLDKWTALDTAVQAKLSAAKAAGTAMTYDVAFREVLAEAGRTQQD